MLLFFVYCYRLFGWGAWIRTMSNLLQRQVCYRYTTPQKYYILPNTHDFRFAIILAI